MTTDLTMRGNVTTTTTTTRRRTSRLYRRIDQLVNVMFVVYK